MRLQLRLSLTISALVIVLSCGFILSLYLVERSYLRAQAEDARSDAAAKLATVCRDSFLSRDDIGLLNYVRHLAASPGTISAAFIGGDNRVLMHSDLSLKGSHHARPWTLSPSARGILHRRGRENSGSREIIEYAAPVDADGVRLGFALLDYDAAAADAEIAMALRNTLRRFGGVSLLCLAAGLLVAHYTAYSFVKPITELTNAVGRVGGGDFSTAIRNDRDDEIGRLSRDFDRMAARLHKLDELKGEFIQTVSHDLRNPLFAIVMTCEYILAKNTLGESEVDLTKTIWRSAQDLSRMVTDILDVSKIQAGKMVYHPEPSSPAELLQSAGALYATMMSAKRLSLAVEVPNAPLSAYVDRTMISRVLSNLISNAVKFSKKGGRIAIGVRPDDATAAAVFFVSDNGVGVPPEELPYLFGRFHQIAQTDPEMKGLHGTGLGLTICKGIIEGHGGKIWVESTQGRGTTIFFSVPKSGPLQENIPS